MKKILPLILVCFTMILNAQVLIDDTGAGTTPDEGAVLELKSNDKGLLLPRVSGELSAMEVEGMIYYDSTNKCFKGWDGTQWQVLGSACTEPIVSPIASNLSVIEDTNNSNNDGTIQDGESVVAQYDYSDPDGNNPEGASTVEWFLATSAGGADEASFGTASSFDTSSFAGFYIRYTVTPVDDQGNSGTPVPSTYVLINPAPSTFAGRINEFHYNDDGTDDNEFVEVRIPLGEDVTNINVTLVNGSDSQSYGQTSLSAITKTSDAMYDYYVWEPSGIQNGPDGIALEDNGTVVEFISYGSGTITYNGTTSTNVGVTESNSTAENSSIQFIDGNGWVNTSGFNTKGLENSETAPAADTSVQFVSTTSTLTEDGATISIELSIADEDATNATTVEVALDGTSTATNGTDYDDGTGTPAAISFPLTVTFPAGSSANQSFDIFISNDDTDIEGNETVILNLQNPAGGNNAMLGTNTTHTLTIQDNDAPASAGFTQDFDGTNTWTYTTDVAFFNNGSDGFYGISDGSSPMAAVDNNMDFSGNFVGVRDLDDEGDNGTTDYATITFANVSITTETTVSFDYDIISFDSTDESEYILVVNGSDQTAVSLPKNSAGSVSLTIPANATQIGLKLRIKQNGGSDYAGFDNFSVQ